METIIDALKAMGKASSMEIAARLNMTRQEVIDQLWELKREGVVEQSGQSWAVPGHQSGNQQNLKADDLIDMIAKNGPMTADELAEKAGVTNRRVASSLAMATSKGKVQRKYVNGKFRYMMPGTGMATASDCKLKNTVPALGSELMPSAPAPKPETAAPSTAPSPTVETVVAPPNAAIERADTETLTLPTVAHLRQRIKRQKAGTRRDEQLLKHLLRVHRLMEVTNG